MCALLAKIQKVNDLLAVGDEPVGDEGSVAVGGIALGAHDADSAGDCGQGAGGELELLGQHVVCVGGSHAAERLALPAIGDTRLLERISKALLRELGMSARGRVGTHVYERADAGFPEDRD